MSHWNQRNVQSVRAAEVRIRGRYIHVAVLSTSQSFGEGLVIGPARYQIGIAE